MELEAAIKEALPTASVETSPQGEVKVKVPVAELKQAAGKLKEMGFNYCSSLTAVDYKDQNRLELVVHVYRMESRGPRVSLRADVARDNPVIDSLTSVWPTTNWHEREAFDMFGIRFEGHPDLRRILLPESWLGGHPLLKDFVDKRPPRPVVTRETYRR